MLYIQFIFHNEISDAVDNKTSLKIPLLQPPSDQQLFNYSIPLSQFTHFKKIALYLKDNQAASLFFSN